MQPTCLSTHSFSLFCLEIDEINTMVNGHRMISSLLCKPLLHSIFHLGSVFIGMCSLSANDFEKMVLTIPDVVLNATAAGVSKILFNLKEPSCSQMECLLNTNYMQVNAVRGVFLFYWLGENLFSHVEFVCLGIFRITLRWTNWDIFACFISEVLHLAE